MSTLAYRQLWRVVSGAVSDALGSHPDYLTAKGRVSAHSSIVKRVTGTVLGFAEEARGRSGVAPAAETGLSAATDVPSGGALSRLPKNSGRSQPKENGRVPEDRDRGDISMLTIEDRPPELNLEPAFSDRQLKAHRDYLVRKIARSEASGQPFAEIVDIGPALAHLLLQRNPADENRKLSRATVEKYAADMASGRWQGLNGQTIVLSKDGYLNDGQHRLNAVIRCGGTIPFTVVFGAERQSRLTLDQNKVRTSGDYIGMAGVKNANKIAAVAAVIYAYENDAVSGGVTNAVYTTDMARPTKALLHQFALDRLDEIEHALRLTDRNDARKLTTDTRLAACIYIVAIQAGWGAVEPFFQSLIEGDNLGKTNPAFTARERLIAERLAGTVPVRRTMEIVFRAWNAHRRGERMSRLTLRGDLPAIEA